VDTAAVDPRPWPEAFDDADAAELAPRLAVCLHAQEWVDRVLAGRPYRRLSRLERAAVTAALELSEDGLAEALAAHPRIGERPTDASGASEHSRREQAGVADDATTAARLHAANTAYEARFGHVFLLRAAGRTAEEVLQAAQDRLGNDPASEGVVVRQQLGEIAVLRLRDLVGELVAASEPGAGTAAGARA
jgi:2-oxo-4-hydroxy-4-carboxy-5-ureidoimidazoline decarboxylase